MKHACHPFTIGVLLLLFGACGAQTVVDSGHSDAAFSVDVLPEEMPQDLKDFVVQNHFLPCEVGYGDCPQLSTNSKMGNIMPSGCLCGDIDNDGVIHEQDVEYLTDYFYRSGVAPLASQECTNLNGKDSLDILDLSLLILFVYRNGSAPTCGGAAPTPTPTATPTPIMTPTPTPLPTATPTPPPPPPPTGVGLAAECETPKAGVPTFYVDQSHTNCDDDRPRSQNSKSAPWCSFDGTRSPNDGLEDEVPIIPGVSAPNAFNYQAYVISGANAFHLAGDTVCVSPGEYPERILPKAGIDSGRHTRIIGYGNPQDVKILGSNKVTSWTPVSGHPGVYQASLSNAGMCGSGNAICFEDRARWYNPVTSLASVGPGQSYYNGSTIFLHPHDGGNANNHQIECASRQVATFVCEKDYGSTWYELKHFTLANVSILQTMGNGFVMGTKAIDITLQDNIFEFTTGCDGSNPAAISHSTDGHEPKATGVKILRNKIRQVGSEFGWALDNGGPHDGSAIKLYSALGAQIVGNDISEAAVGIEVKRGNADVLIQSNRIYRIGGLAMRLSAQNCDIRIFHNEIFDIRSDAIGVLGGHDFVNIQNNTFWNVGGGIQFNPKEHPLINNAGRWPIACPNSPGGMTTDDIRFTTIRNNIFGVGSGPEFEIYDSANERTLLDGSDYNFFDSNFGAPRFEFNGTRSLSSWSSTDVDGDGVAENDKKSIVGNPSFVNAPVDFHLNSSSSACMSGLNNTYAGAHACQ